MLLSNAEFNVLVYAGVLIAIGIYILRWFYMAMGSDSHKIDRRVRPGIKWVRFSWTDSNAPQHIATVMADGTASTVTLCGKSARKTGPGGRQRRWTEEFSDGPLSTPVCRNCIAAAGAYTFVD